jgi:hypothetical protein
MATAAHHGHASVPDRTGRWFNFRHRAWRGSRWLAITLAVLLVLLVIARLLLPLFLKRAINARLEAIPEYAGSVQSVGVSLFRGAYQLHGVEIHKRNAPRGEPFFAAERIDFSIAWRELWRRHIVADILVEEGRLNFTKEPAEEFSQLDVDRRWQDAIQDIFPIDITHLEIRNGFLHYIDRSTTPGVDVFVNHAHVIATGLRNRPADANDKFPANLLIEGDSVGGGRLSVVARAEPLAEQPHFELRVTLDRVNLPELNDLLRAYGNVDVSAGVMQLYLEMAARDGRFEGYVKPFFDQIDFRDLAEDDKNIAEKIWEKIVSGAVALFKNKPRDQLATRVPFAGEFGSADVGLLATLRTMLRHGFIEPLPQQLERSVKSEDIPPAPEKAQPPAEPKR